jgi:hypothetical protein
VGTRVDVFVGNKIGVTVAGCIAVDVGSWVAVQVGGTIGVTGTIRFNPPQAIRNNASTDIPINVFRKRLQWMIQIPENPQAFEREPRGDDLDHVGFLRDDR